MNLNGEKQKEEKKGENTNRLFGLRTSKATEDYMLITTTGNRYTLNRQSAKRTDKKTKSICLDYKDEYHGLYTKGM